MPAILPKSTSGCPRLFLAPMEGVGDRGFRKAMATIGGFDECCTEFIRVPANAHIPSLSKVYESFETAPIPLAAQIMGSEPQLMGEMAAALEEKGAPRIDLNCGCPSNTVTGRGAGSSLLKEPAHLYEVAKSIVGAVKVPVTAKLRTGFQDTSLFKENILAAQESGIQFLTLHPRTKVDGYGPPAKWEYIAEAKALLKIPVVGNGDILTVEDGLRMLHETQCDALMIGRGAVINPFIFHEIKAHFAGGYFTREWEAIRTYFDVFCQHTTHLSVKGQISKLKQIICFLFKSNANLIALKNQVLTLKTNCPHEFLDTVLKLLKCYYI
ncbi:MAG: tRNA-dihydrouridine synthase family protein [Parachlamydia sp.]|jgi:tRNA-dihydrouridine synthase C|nr:tRNA-dihydrouridine synthase family protein [Parachlamydia sp.]